MGALLIRGLAAAAAALLIVGCGGDDTTTKPGPDMALNSICGHPGDKGNSLGVGQFCMTLSDCSNNSKAVLCSTLGSDNSYFCTMPCTASDMGNPCGENAFCACGSGSSQSGCGCYPTACMQ